MIKLRAERNRTISLTDKETDIYYNKCITISSQTELSCILDSIISGDTLNILDFLPYGFVDLLVIDPPYNLNKMFGGSMFSKMNDDDYYAFTESWINKIKKLLNKTASIYVCCDWRSSLIIGSVLQKHFFIQNRITWQREKGRGALHNWKNSMEDIWFATVSPKNYSFNVNTVKMRRMVIAPYKVDGKPKDWIESEDGKYRDTYPSNFWDDVSVPYWSMPENTDHPTQKPEKLIAKLILASSNPNDIILDPFLGSGTTAVVAKKLKRHFVGIEVEHEYCAIAQKRLELAEHDNEIQGYSSGVFWERNTLAFQQKYRSDPQISEQISFAEQLDIIGRQ